MSQQPSAHQTSQTKLIVGFCIGWAVLSLLFFLLFGVRAPGEESLPEWFLIAINLLEITSFALAAILCFRNAGSSQIISGRGVWLPMAIAMLSYTIGSILFALWGTFFGLDPEVSPGDFFFLLCYVFLFIGLLQAVLPRRIDLSLPQWALIAGIGFLGVGLAYSLNYGVPALSNYPNFSNVAYAASGSSVMLAQASPPAKAPAPTKPPAAAPVKPPPAPANTAPAKSSPASPVTTPTTSKTTPVAAPAAVTPSRAPAWAISFDEKFAGYADTVSVMYVIGDCLLIVIAATLLVAFWDGRFSQSWKLIAIASFFLYIADMFFAFDVSRDAYVEGAVWEVFWTLSGIFFALGAAVEYEISTRSRRGSRRRS